MKEHVSCIVCNSIVNIIQVEGPSHKFWKCMDDRQCRQNILEELKASRLVGKKQYQGTVNTGDLSILTDLNTKKENHG